MALPVATGESLSDQLHESRPDHFLHIVVLLDQLASVQAHGTSLGRVRANDQLEGSGESRHITARDGIAVYALLEAVRSSRCGPPAGRSPSPPEPPGSSLPSATSEHNSLPGRSEHGHHRANQQRGRVDSGPTAPPWPWHCRARSASLPTRLPASPKKARLAGHLHAQLLELLEKVPGRGREALHLAANQVDSKSCLDKGLSKLMAHSMRSRPVRQSQSHQDALVHRVNPVR